MKLSREFYSRNTEIVAQELLGKILVHETKEGICKGKIVETEAYLGLDDPGAIGYRKVRNIPQSLLKSSGHAFVYFTYGNHWMLNVVAKENTALLGAVLIRAVEPFEGIDLMKKRRMVNDVRSIANGPGKLTKAFGIDKRYDGLDLTKSVLFIEDSDEKFCMVRNTRIGLSKGKEKLLRFYVKDNAFISKR
jgi:DNA-3-methyladenine glycosylase